MTPASSLARLPVALFVTLLAFVATTNVPLGIAWRWRFLAAAVFCGALVMGGRALRRRIRRDEGRWARALPFQWEQLKVTGDGAVLFELFFESSQAPTVGAIHRALRSQGLEERFELIHSDESLAVLKHLDQPWWLRRDAHALARAAASLQQYPALQRLRVREVKQPAVAVAEMGNQVEDTGFDDRLVETPMAATLATLSHVYRDRSAGLLIEEREPPLMR